MDRRNITPYNPERQRISFALIREGSIAGYYIELLKARGLSFEVHSEDPKHSTEFSRAFVYRAQDRDWDLFRLLSERLRGKLTFLQDRYLTNLDQIPLDRLLQFKDTAAEVSSDLISKSNGHFKEVSGV